MHCSVAATRKGTAAFTLIELSIVLVIIGLLVGGVLSGQTLIRSAELRSISTDYTRFVTANNTFRDKYFAIPGDMSNATSFWGTGTCPGTNATVTSALIVTCNGDGDGQISATSTNANEPFRYWQHLANAKIVEGSFTGVANSATATALVSSLSGASQNAPRSKVSNAGWTPVYVGTIANTPTTTYYEGNYDNVLLYGSVNSTNGTNGPTLKTEEAWNIDTKLDDAKPGTGIVTTLESNTATTSATAGCGTVAAAATDIAATSAYNLVNSSTNMCTLVFKLGF